MHVQIVGKVSSVYTLSFFLLRSTDTEMEIEDPENLLTGNKCIVYMSQLEKLFCICLNCQSECTVRNYIEGTSVTFTQHCNNCSFVRVWDSQPKLKGAAAGNIALAASILFSGSSPTQIFKLLNHLNCATLSYSSFTNYQSAYFFPVISQMWHEKKSELLSELTDVELAGDGRADSPGHCAKYGTYTLMETTQNKVIAINVVQVDFDVQMYTLHFIFFTK